MLSAQEFHPFWFKATNRFESDLLQHKNAIDDKTIQMKSIDAIEMKAPTTYEWRHDIPEPLQARNEMKKGKHIIDVQQSKQIFVWKQKGLTKQTKWRK